MDCNQRREFLELAASLHCPAHAVMLQLPAKTCLQRARDREGHEGGVQGKGAARVVSMMLGQLSKAGGWHAAGWVGQPRQTAEICATPANYLLEITDHALLLVPYPLQRPSLATACVFKAAKHETTFALQARPWPQRASPA